MMTAREIPIETAAPASGKASGAQSEEERLSAWPFGSVPRYNWGWFAVRGVLAILLGALALLAPGLTLFAFALVFAAYSTIDGIFQLITGVRGARRKEDRWWTLVIAGLAGVVVGALFVIWPLLSTLAYALMLVAIIGVWGIVSGVSQLIAAIRLRREIEGEWLLGLSGAATAGLGAILLVLALANPGLTVLSVGWLIGVWALVTGIMLLILAVRLKRRDKQPAARGGEDTRVRAPT